MSQTSEGLSPEIVAELQQAVRDVLARSGYYPTSDAVILLEALSPNGGTSFTQCVGNLLPWVALGRLEYASTAIRANRPR